MLDAKHFRSFSIYFPFLSMATLLNLSSGPSPALEWLDPALEEGTQELRYIICSPKLRTWIDQDLAGLVSTLGVELSPVEQLFTLVQEFCSDEPLTYGDVFKILRPREKGVWELKTPDLRIFGWFPLKNHFIAVVANDADFIKRHDLYAGISAKSLDLETA
jgi:hypothetical protein